MTDVASANEWVLLQTSVLPHRGSRLWAAVRIPTFLLLQQHVLFFLLTCHTLVPLCLCIYRSYKCHRFFSLPCLALCDIDGQSYVYNQSRWNTYHFVSIEKSYTILLSFPCFDYCLFPMPDSMQQSQTFRFCFGSRLQTRRYVDDGAEEEKKGIREKLFEATDMGYFHPTNYTASDNFRRQ